MIAQKRTEQNKKEGKPKDKKIKKQEQEKLVQKQQRSNKKKTLTQTGVEDLF